MSIHAAPTTGTESPKHHVHRAHCGASRGIPCAGSTVAGHGGSTMWLLQGHVIRGLDDGWMGPTRDRQFKKAYQDHQQ